MTDSAANIMIAINYSLPPAMNESNLSLDCGCQCYSPSNTLSQVINMMKFTFCCIGFIVNVIEISIFMSKELRNRSSMLLAGTSLSNLLVITFEVFHFVVMKMCSQYAHQLRYLLVVTFCVQSLAYCNSVFILVILSYERCRVVCSPLAVSHHQRIKDVALVSTVLVLGFSYSVLRLVAYPTPIFRELPRNDLAYSILLFYWLLVVLVIPSVVLSVTTFILTQKLRHRHAALQSITRQTQSHGSTGASKIIVAIAILFLLTAAIPRTLDLMTRILVFFDVMGGRSEMSLNSVIVVIEITSFLSLDSVFYFLFNKQYRRKFLQLCRTRKSGEANAASAIVTNDNEEAIKFINQTTV